MRTLVPTGRSFYTGHVTDIHNLSALDQAAAVRSGELSPAEITAHYLDRIDRLGAGLGAFVTVTPELAIAQAQQAAGQLGRPLSRRPCSASPSRSRTSPAPPGIRTTFGSRLFADYVPDADAHVVTMLRAAGTISLGKTNTPEFGLCCYTDNDVTGPARSPWDPRCNAGGSSGGAAAAVAAGLVPFAHGSDGGGSLRIPASVCGLVGLKPARGRISNGPQTPDGPGLSTQGPLARTVRDAAALLDAMAGPDARRSLLGAAAAADGQTFLGFAGQATGRLRIGRYAVTANGTTPDPACIAAWEDVSALLASLGHDVEDIELPFPPDIVNSFNTIWAVNSLARQTDAAGEQQLRPVTRAWRDYGRTMTGAAYADAVSAMQLADQDGSRRDGPVRRAADADARAAAAAGRVLPRGRRRDGQPARAGRVHAVHADVQHDRPARGQPAAALDRRRRADRGVAHRAARRRGPADRARGPARGGQALGAPHAAVLVGSTALVTGTAYARRPPSSSSVYCSPT